MTGGPGHTDRPTRRRRVAGVLEDLPGLLAVGMPSLASYLRLIPQRWPPPYRCSGRENRKPEGRLAAASTDASVEVRCLDPSANRFATCSTAPGLRSASPGLSAGYAHRPRVTVDPVPRADRSTMPGSSHSSLNPTAPPPGCSPSSSGAGPIDTVLVLVADP